MSMRLQGAAFLKSYPNSERPTIRIIAVTNARFASLHGLPFGPVPLSTSLVPLHKLARHERAFARRRCAAGFRLRPGGGTVPLADHGPKLSFHAASGGTTRESMFNTYVLILKGCEWRISMCGYD